MCGTIHHVPVEVTLDLQQFQQQGWQILRGPSMDLSDVDTFSLTGLPAAERERREKRKSRR